MQPMTSLIPYTEELIRSHGYVAWREIEPGEYLGVLPMTFGKGRLCTGLTVVGYELGYCYESLSAAIVAMHAFRPQEMAEPDGWFREVTSGRRREGGDPAKETFNF